MISRRVLDDLLQQPLGPYHDRDVLHETACQMKGGSKPVLYSFILEHNGHVTGLDASELRPSEGPDNRKFRFRGVLKVANPGWLTDFGLKTVETELNLRAQERALREGERVRAELTLEGLFESRLLTRSDEATWRKDETRLTVLIQGERGMSALYMRTSQVPNGLLWSSKDHNRKYEVATMDVATYSHSENFFWRWRLVALMEKISKQYRYIAPNKRTPIWFVEKYIADYACPPEDKHQRLICDEQDTDVDETGKTVTPRHLLRPHVSEILGIFAAHAQWLITHDVRRDKLFDIKSWERFAKAARKHRKEAARQGVRWGWAEGEEVVEESSEEEEGSADDLDKLVRENPVIGKSKKTVVRKLQLARARQGDETALNVSSDSESDGDDAPGRAEYVSDFSEPSDAEENDSDHRPAEEEVADLLPWQLLLPPLFPDVDGRWWCPLQECNYLIDLNDLTEEEGIPQDLVNYILQKQWRSAVYDEVVLEGFKRLVTNHYLKHLKEWGVKVEKREGKPRFAFVNGRRRRRHGCNPEEPIRGPMPARGILGGESRVIPIVHAPQVEHFQ